MSNGITDSETLIGNETVKKINELNELLLKLADHGIHVDLSVNRHSVMGFPVTFSMISANFYKLINWAGK